MLASLFFLLRRPARRNGLIVVVLFVVVCGWWLSIEPSNERVWLEDVAELPNATFDGDVVTLALAGAGAVELLDSGGSSLAAGQTGRPEEE